LPLGRNLHISIHYLVLVKKVKESKGAINSASSVFFGKKENGKKECNQKEI